MATMMVFQRAKSSGKCPPSLISQNRVFEDDGFDAILNPIFEDQSGLALGSASLVTSGFSSAVKLAASVDKFPSKMDPQQKAAVLEFRRCLLLAIVGATPSENQALQQILNGGFLGVVKKWLDDILAGNVGGTDLLLHMLSNVSELPVSKSAVMSSGLGKVIGIIGKHKICAGTANEQKIKNTIVQVKQNWSASVKQKRREDTASIINKTKKAPPSNNESGGGNLKSAPTADSSSSKITGLVTKASGPSAENKVQWADHSGGDLEEAQTQEGGKRDRVQDAADYLAHAKRSKIDRDVSDPRNGMRPTSFWHPPMLLRVTSNITVESGELEEQKRRVNTITPPIYVSDGDVPRNPNSQTEGEEARDLATTSFTSSSIPFFTPNHISQAESLNFQQATSQQQMHSPKGSALRGKFSESNSGYDEGRSQKMMDHGKSKFGQQQHQQQQKSSQMGIYQQAQGSGPSHLQQISSQQQQHGVGSYGGSSHGNRQDKGSNSGNSDKNLHVSGYGPNTTLADIVNLFAPHVQVTEVVMKRGFAFVNTNDASRARRAKEVLNGALLKGSPIRINFAQRSSRDGGFSSTSTNSSSSSSIYGGGGGHNRSSSYSRGDGGPLPQNQYGQIDYDAVRDDRGNPATKNLFVAGYGAGTTEQQLGDIFGQHAMITGCVMKGTFSFVNTCDKVSAVHARNALAGSILNGGVMRINFAKETGRLGTNF